MTQGDLPEGMGFGTVRQWVAAGLPHARFRALVRGGTLVRVRPGVYATARLVAWAEDSPSRSEALRAAAAMAALGTPDVAVSHESAAVIHGLDLFDDRSRGEAVTITRPALTNRGRTAGVRFYSGDLPSAQVTRCYGIPVTTLARTVVDLARSSSFMGGVVVADSALRLRKVTRAEMEAVLETCPRWPGVSQARRVVEFGNGLAESVLESCARVVFARHGFDPPELQVPILTTGGIFRVDFYFRNYWTIAEADGLLKYKDPKRAVAQLRRDQFLRETGRNVVHFTWNELFHQEPLVIARLTTALAQPTTQKEHTGRESGPLPYKVRLGS